MTSKEWTRWGDDHPWLAGTMQLGIYALCWIGWIAAFLIVCLVISLFATACAQASPGSVAAHSSNQAAKRKFAKVTPDTWSHVEGKCRWTSTWKYWHCTSKVDGEKGYHGTFKVLVNHATLKAYVRGFVVTT